MDFAADAVLEVIAPPTRSAHPRAPAKPDNGPSFDDHLESATAEAEPQVRADAAKETAADTPSPQDTKESAEKPADAAPTAEQVEAPAAAFVVQIMSPSPAPAAPIVTAPETTMAVEPAETASTAPEAPLPQTSDARAPIHTGVKSESAKSDAAGDKALAADASSAPRAATAPVSVTPQAGTSPPPAVPLATQPVSAPLQPTATAAAATEETAQGMAMAVAQAPQSPPREAPRTQKSAPGIVESQAEPPVADSKPTRSETPPPRVAFAAAIGAALRDVAPPAAPPAADTGAPTPSSSGAPGLTQHAAQTQQAVAVDHNVARAAPAATQVAREIVRRFDGETTRFELRLDPAELGRVEVRLEVTRDHRVTAVVSADNPQALTELARHARDLEQTLQSAGLELSENGLSFDLRQGGEGDADAGEGGGDSHVANAEAEQQQPATSRPLGFERWRGVRVDMMV